MKIQIKSDLHLEFSSRSPFSALSETTDFSEWDVNPEADVLVLAGDICNKSSINRLKEKLEQIKIPVIYVPGNHECYGGDIFDTPRHLAQMCRDVGATFLNPGWHIINDVLFIGATMWTPLLDPLAIAYFSGWSDRQCIKGMSVRHWQESHLREITFIEQNLKLDNFRDMRKVVISHHLPTMQSVPERFKTDSTNPYFVANCDHIFNSGFEPDLWLQGHTHDSCDYTIGKTRVVCNPYGYWPNAVNPKFDRSLIVEI